MKRTKPYATETIRKRAVRLGVKNYEICVMCLNLIRTMAYKGTGVCCENCNKARKGDLGTTPMTVDEPMTARH